MRAVAATDERGRASGFERSYDGLALLLLMWPATGGMALMGSTRVWGYAPGLVLSFAGAALVLLRPVLFRTTPGWRLPPGFGLFTALTAYVTASILWAAVPAAARWESLRWTALLAAGWAWVQMAGRAHRWKWLLGVLLLAAALNSLYAIVQEVNRSNQVLWTVRPEQYGMRASGTFLCPNHFANVLAMLFPLALALIFLPEAGFPVRILAVYFLAVSAPALYWTQSRSGWLGMAVGVAVTAVLLAWRKSTARLLAVLAFLPLLAAVGGGLAWQTLPAVRERIGAVLENPEKAGGIRMQMWRDVPAMARARPLWGYGGGSFVWVYPPWQTHVRHHLTWDYLHNEYLQMQVEYGATGLALLLAGVAWTGLAAAGAVRRSRSRAAAVLLAGAAGSLAAALFHALFDFNFHVFPNPHILVWIGGVAWSVWICEERGAEVAAGWRRGWQAGMGFAAAILCAFCAWKALAGGMSYFWNLRGEIARVRMEWDAAAAAYRRAHRWDPGNWQPLLGLGHVRSVQSLWLRDPDPAAEQAERRRLADEAAGYYRRTLELNPGEMAAMAGLGRAENAVGDREGALGHFRTAAAYQRRHIFYREQLGIQLRGMGRDQEALEVFRQNVADGVASDISTLNIRALERKLAADSPPPAAP